MKSYHHFLQIVLIFIGSYFQLNVQNLQINEIVSSNANTLIDEDGDCPDWIELKNAGNTDIVASEPIILYLNGEYWGHMSLREKINEDYLENNHNVDDDCVDLLELNGDILEGSNEKYLELLNILEQNNMSLNSSYETVSEMNEIADRIERKILKIYPNPFSDETTITWENNDFSTMEIRIFTLDGRLVYQNSVNGGELIWDGTSKNHQRLEPGIYICNVLSGGRFYTEKLILTQ